MRYNSKPADAEIEIKNQSEAEIIFKNPTFNVCPGQFAVCYFDDYLALGGVIDRVD